MFPVSFKVFQLHIHLLGNYSINYTHLQKKDNPKTHKHFLDHQWQWNCLKGFKYIVNSTKVDFLLY